MTSRATQQARFLMCIGWSDAVKEPITGDASARQYHRLTQPESGQTAILMDAPLDLCGTMQPFVEVASYLSNVGLSAPKIMHQDIEQGFLLLEDLGRAVFAAEIASDPRREAPLYTAAVHLIAKLHDHPNERLPLYDADKMAEAVDLAFLHYRATPTDKLDAPAKDASALLWEHLTQLSNFSTVSLRDYHAENLLWLPDRDEDKRVGLLDFQDAVQTHPAYDLVSLLRDARRDVSPELADHLIGVFCHLRGYDEDRFRAEAALISVQRNLRILGIFARLSRQMGKPHYVDLIPRVWDHLQRDLDHPSLDRLRPTLRTILPAPEPDFLTILRSPCQTLR